MYLALEVPRRRADNYCMMNEMEETVKKIAKVHLRIDNLDEQGSDRLDFHELHVLSIRDALNAAYKRGAIDATIEAGKVMLKHK